MLWWIILIIVAAAIAYTVVIFNAWCARGRWPTRRGAASTCSSSGAVSWFRTWWRA
jgi:hypothetical protein